MPCLLAISGSLRSGSTNAALLRAIATAAPPDTTVELFGGLGELPENAQAIRELVRGFGDHALEGRKPMDRPA